jgi:hypothetical protein
VIAVGVPAASRPLRAARGPGLAAGRLLRLELRRSTMLWILPLLAVLLAVTELRNDLGQVPLWAVRSIAVQHQVELTGGIVAAVAAWTAGRDGRRQVTDLVVTTALPRWGRQLANWAAVTIWAMAFYAACVAVVFVATAGKATWGGPIWWLPGVGAAAVVAFSAVGFAFGAFFPGRFAAPLVAIGALFAPQIGVLALQRHQQWGRVTFARDSTVPGTGIFFPFHAGISIVQIMFLAGVAAVALGILALPAAAGGRRLRRAGAMIALAGLAAAGEGLALAGTARQTAQGIVIPALDHAPSDRLITYTPACDNTSAIPLCVHPAFRALLPALAAAVDPVLSQVAGLPGGPVRVRLSPATPQELDNFNMNVGVDSGGDISISGGPTISGRPPVLYLNPNVLPLVSGIDLTGELRLPVAATIIQTLIYAGHPVGQPRGKPVGQGAGSPGSKAVGSLAQRAIAAALLKVAGVPLIPPADAGARQPGNGVPGPAPGSPTYAAADRFAALPAATRHAWLAAHLAALRAGRVTLTEIP